MEKLVSITGKCTDKAALFTESSNQINVTTPPSNLTQLTGYGGKNTQMKNYHLCFDLRLVQMKNHMSHFHDELFLQLPCLSNQLKEGGK